MKFSFSRKGDNKIEVGCWVSLDDEKFEGQLILDDPRDGPAVRVLSTESKRYKDAYDKGVRKYQRVIRDERFIPWHLREKIENMAMQAAITDWIGVPDAEGNLVAFSKEAVLDALENEPDFRRRAYEVATDLGYFKKQEEERDSENLENSSSQSLNGARAAETASPASDKPLH